MIRQTPRVRLFAIALSALAGYVDAVGFMALGGFFVSFMSGNTTRMAVGLIDHTDAALRAASLIVLFVGGVIMGSLVGRIARRRRASVLLLVATLLATAALGGSLGWPLAAAAGMALAMGAENAVFARDGDVQIGLTYMTGTLVKMGQHMASAMMGEARWDWCPFALLWLGLATGAMFGAMAHTAFGLGALWVAATFALLAAVFSSRFEPT
ncbi:YoaK family protein [Sphingobium algorifonticola]|uniref:DUF1275 domain-containing protein n=1 Tax=Sphingobium algorifonticola TaxID=2008318 RepID=A0A437J7E5_9SPHN|nr:YoaK family protein [Sphingobium algorifonticola]RVT41092.1 DUF1275 domain-containing protein [Sphingobium algorifonticola]